MEQKIKQPKRKYPRKYSTDVVQKVLSLVREGKTLKEILPLVPCKKNAVRRYVRKAELTIKK